MPVLQTGALVAVLKEARKRSLLPQLNDAVPSGSPDGTVEVHVPTEQLLAAAVHREEPVRLDALTLACHSPRSAAMPGGASICWAAHGLRALGYVTAAHLTYRCGGIWGGAYFEGRSSLAPLGKLLAHTDHCCSWEGCQIRSLCLGKCGVGGGGVQPSCAGQDSALGGPCTSKVPSGSLQPLLPARGACLSG